MRGCEVEWNTPEWNPVNTVMQLINTENVSNLLIYLATIDAGKVLYVLRRINWEAIKCKEGTCGFKCFVIVRTAVTVFIFCHQMKLLWATTMMLFLPHRFAGQPCCLFHCRWHRIRNLRQLCGWLLVARMFVQNVKNKCSLVKKSWGSAHAQLWRCTVCVHTHILLWNRKIKPIIL